MVMIFKDTYEDLTPQRLAEIIDAFEAGKGATVKPGPQIDRMVLRADAGFTSLQRRKGDLEVGPTARLRSRRRRLPLPSATPQPFRRARPQGQDRRA